MQILITLTILWTSSQLDKLLTELLILVRKLSLFIIWYLNIWIQVNFLLLFFLLLYLLCGKYLEWLLGIFSHVFWWQLVFRIFLWLVSSHLLFPQLIVYLLLTQDWLLLLNLLFSHSYIFILSLSRFWIYPIHSLTLCALYQCTSAMGINDFGLAYPTCKNTIQWKTFVNFITHATYEHLRISRNSLCKCTFSTIYSPKLR